MARSRSVSLWSARSLLRLLLLSLLCAALVRESEALCGIISADSLMAVCRIGSTAPLFFAYYPIPFACDGYSYIVPVSTLVGQCSLMTFGTALTLDGLPNGASEKTDGLTIECTNPSTNTKFLRPNNLEPVPETGSVYGCASNGGKMTIKMPTAGGGWGANIEVTFDRVSSGTTVTIKGTTVDTNAVVATTATRTYTAVRRESIKGTAAGRREGSGEQRSNRQTAEERQIRTTRITRSILLCCHLIGFASVAFSSAWIFVSSCSSHFVRVRSICTGIKGHLSTA